MTEFPDDLKYSADHEWVRPGNGSVVRVGVSEYAVGQLGDVVFVTLPEVGAQVSAGDACGELESTKTVEDIISPVDGVVTGTNETVASTPETINQDPYGDGWLFEVEVSDEDAVAEMMDADAYAEHVGE